MNELAAVSLKTAELEIPSPATVPLALMRRPEPPVRDSPQREVTQREPLPKVQNPTDMENLIRHLDANTTVVIPAGVKIIGSIETDGKAAVVVHGTVEGTVSAGEMPV